ncbi:barstar family protein [Flavobacterium sp.]|uniref:barstar family protein n=1 Tax=Flavobacterium sp. TaxID=239 RepID=UPI00374CA69E
MIKFKNEPVTWGRLDYEIISRGFLKPYSDDEALKEDTYWLKSEDYKVIEFNCLDLSDKEIMHNTLHAQFDFPNYYGHNWDALQECLNEIEITDNGLVVVFNSLDKINNKIAYNLIDIFVSSAQRHRIFSEILLILIKVENRNFTLNPFGASNFFWY